MILMISFPHLDQFWYRESSTARCGGTQTRPEARTETYVGSKVSSVKAISIKLESHVRVLHGCQHITLISGVTAVNLLTSHWSVTTCDWMERKVFQDFQKTFRCTMTCRQDSEVWVGYLCCRDTEAEPYVIWWCIKRCTPEPGHFWLPLDWVINSDLDSERRVSVWSF